MQLTQAQEELLLSFGWHVVHPSPVSLRHRGGAKAAGVAAVALMADIQAGVGASNSALESVEPTYQSLLTAFLSACEDLFFYEDAVRTAKEGLDGEDKWATLYDIVFSDHGNGRIAKLLRQMNHSIDYYDPDTTYEEDATAYLKALRAKYDELKQFLR